MLEVRELSPGQRFALKAADILYRHKQANPEAVWELAKTHRNPDYTADLFNDPDSGYNRHLWPVALINGSGRVAQAPRGEAASIDARDNVLNLRVYHDANFDHKTQHMFDEPAAEAYNNAHMEGLRGFLPTPAEDVVYACDMRLRRLEGTTGIWVEEADTFDPTTGVMKKPFRSFGFSWSGDTSAPFIRGLSVQTVVGFAPKVQNISGVDPGDWHTYAMRWGWYDSRMQTVKFSIDGKLITEMPVHPFGPSECQLWGDNYDVQSAVKIRFRNITDFQETQYMNVRAFATPFNR